MEKKLMGNCKKCIEYLKQSCTDNGRTCICRCCPRNLGKCIVTRWCSETESPLDIADWEIGSKK